MADWAHEAAKIIFNMNGNRLICARDIENSLRQARADALEEAAVICSKYPYAMPMEEEIRKLKEAGK